MRSQGGVRCQRSPACAHECRNRELERVRHAVEIDRHHLLEILRASLMQGSPGIAAQDARIRGEDVQAAESMLGLADEPLQIFALSRSEERRGGKECVGTCRSRWYPYH